jgi:hypothetical protein
MYVFGCFESNSPPHVRKDLVENLDRALNLRSESASEADSLESRMAAPMLSAGRAPTTTLPRWVELGAGSAPECQTHCYPAAPALSGLAPLAFALR